MTTTHPATTEVVCPPWCDDHETLRECDPKLAHYGEVFLEEHRSEAAGPFKVSIKRCIDGEPLSLPWPRTFIRAESAYNAVDHRVVVNIGGLSVEEVRQLAAEIVTAAETLEAEAQA